MDAPSMEYSVEVPDEFICPLTLEIMKDPVVSRYGNSFERSAIVEWLKNGTHDCPLTRRPLTLQGVITNHRLRTRIREWQINNEMDVVLVMKPSAESAFCAYLDMPEDDTERASSSDEEEGMLRETPIFVTLVEDNPPGPLAPRGEEPTNANSSNNDSLPVRRRRRLPRFVRRTLAATHRSS